MAKPNLGDGESGKRYICRICSWDEMKKVEVEGSENFDRELECCVCGRTGLIPYYEYQRSKDWKRFNDYVELKGGNAEEAVYLLEGVIDRLVTIASDYEQQIRKFRSRPRFR